MRGRRCLGVPPGARDALIDHMDRLRGLRQRLTVRADLLIADVGFYGKVTDIPPT